MDFLEPLLPYFDIPKFKFKSVYVLILGYFYVVFVNGSLLANPKFCEE